MTNRRRTALAILLTLVIALGVPSVPMTGYANEEQAGAVAVEQSEQPKEQSTDVPAAAPAAPAEQQETTSVLAESTTEGEPAKATDTMAEEGANPEGEATQVAPAEQPAEQTEPAKNVAATILRDGFLEPLEYETVARAVADVKPGEIVVVQKDFKDYITITGEEVTIDLNGHTWSAKGGAQRHALLAEGGAKVTVKNGTLRNGKGKISSQSTVQVTRAQLTMTKVTFTANASNVVRNDNGTLALEDCYFAGNDFGGIPGAGDCYLVYNYGSNAKTTIARTTFENNKRTEGGIVGTYGYSSSYGTTAETSLVSCDIKNNVNKKGAINVGGYSGIRLKDTTVTGNKGGLYTSGFNFASGKIFWEDSAIYKNSATGSDCGDDFYFSNTTKIQEGVVPLAKDMVDHGTKLDNHLLIATQYGDVATEPISNKKEYRRQWTVEYRNNTEATWEYRGKTYVTLTDAMADVNEEGAVITLMRDAAVQETIQATKGLVLDLNGYSLSGLNKINSILSVNGNDVTIKNGTITAGQTTSNQTPSLYLCKCDAVLENILFTDSVGSAVRAYRPVDDATNNITVTNCQFLYNGTPSGHGQYGLEIIGYNATVDGCVFIGNAHGLRIANTTKDLNRKVLIDGCYFTSNVNNAMELLCGSGNSIQVVDTVIERNTGLGKGKAVVDMPGCGSTTNVHGGEKIFTNCTIRNNHSANRTMDLEAGGLTMENCLIQGNSAEECGAIYVNLFGALHLKDTVIKENKSTGSTSKTSGGVAVYGANVVVITPGIGSTPGSSYEAGYYASGMTMEGGALYNNSTSRTSPSADDLYVSRNCKVVLPAASEMVDGDVDFSELKWHDDGNDRDEDKPAEKTYAYRYYKVGGPTKLKQIYIDGTNGSDENPGTKTAPVQSLAKATELARLHECPVVVLGTIVVGQTPTAKHAPARRDLADTANTLSAETQSVVLDLNGQTLQRDPSFKGYLIEVADGGELTIKDTVLDGRGQSSVKPDAALVHVAEGGELVLAGGAILQNNGYNTYGNHEKGGAVYAQGKVTMFPGAAMIKNYALSGGGIYLEGNEADFIMEGGRIENNTACYTNFHKDHQDNYGGGVMMAKGATMTMNDGSISNNFAFNCGGGISMGNMYQPTVSDCDTITLTMNGGTIDANTALNSGGGIFVQCNTEAYIHAGTISNNVAEADGNTETYLDPAYFAGGGIYVNGFHQSAEQAYGFTHGKLYLTNVEIANNTAEWEGGAIAICGSGNGNISEIAGTAIHDNNANAKSDGVKHHRYNTGVDGWNGASDVYFDNLNFIYDYERHTWADCQVADTLEHTSYMSEKMLSGADYHWTDENGDEVPVQELHAISKQTRLYSDVTASDPQMQASIAKSTVHITGNRGGSNGGGIGCNGSIFVGYEPSNTSITIQAEKTMDGEVPEDGEFEFELYQVEKNGDLTLLETVKNNQNGKVSFKTLTYENPGTYEYRICEKQGRDSTIQYDTREYTATVTVTAKENVLSAKLEYDLGGGALPEGQDVPLFENKTAPPDKPKELPVTPPIRAQKLLNGSNPGNATFTFELYDMNGAEPVLIDSVQNQGQAIEFNGLSFDTEGTYLYKIVEKNDGDPTIIYDTKEIEVEIVVTKQGDELTHTVNYYGQLEDGKPIFNNQKTPPEEPEGDEDEPPAPPKDKAPKTADAGEPVLALGIMGWALLALLATCRKKREAK